MTTYLGSKPVGISGIVKKEVPKVKFGATVDTFLGDVDENGVLQKPSFSTELNFAGVKEIGSFVLQNAFYSCTGITSVDLSSLQTVGSSGMQAAFQNCKGITSVNLSSLQTVDGYGMQYAFSGCTGITSVDLSSLQTVGSSGMGYAFGYCTKLPSMSFPSLTSIQNNSFGTASYNYAFANCVALTEIHFRADMQATIEAMSGYSSKWGATNATIYFDL